MSRLFARFLFLAMCSHFAGCSGLPEKSVRPAVNDEFRKTPTGEWVKRFESESREIFQQREKIADMLDLKPGMAVGDVGAGTGFFSELFARRVGPTGHIYAVDIMPQFLELIRTRAQRTGLNNISTILCPSNATGLPARSIDLAFVCDTYHHFEYPKSTLRSLHNALRPGGQLIVIDFERVPGKSRPWVIEHVRAGRDVFTAEIVAAGFELIDSPATPWLGENYVLRFRKLEKVVLATKPRGSLTASAASPM